MARRDDRTSLNYWIKSAIAGGVAGGVAKTAVAPLDRVKILFQTHNQDYVRYSGSWRGIAGAVGHIARYEGIRGLLRGHSLTLARAVPHAAIGYSVYDAARKLLIRTPEQDTAFRRLLTGSMAGMAAMPVTYPFEVIRVRMAVQTTVLPPSQRTVWSAIRTIYTEPSPLPPPLHLFHFYRGFAVSLIGTIPYRGGIFLVWETLKGKESEWLAPEFLEENRNKVHLAIGAIAGASAQIATYPLEVIRRNQQANGAKLGREIGLVRFLTFRETVQMVWKAGGWKGFYIGMGLGLVKQVPVHSISLAVWQAMKGLLEI